MTKQDLKIIKKGFASDRSIYIRKIKNENVITDGSIIIANYKMPIIIDALKFGFMNIVPDGDYEVDIKRNYFKIMLFPNYQDMIERAKENCIFQIKNTTLIHDETLIFSILGNFDKNKYCFIRIDVVNLITSLLGPDFEFQRILTDKSGHTFLLEMNENEHILFSGIDKKLDIAKEYLK